MNRRPVLIPAADLQRQGWCEFLNQSEPYGWEGWFLDANRLCLVLDHGDEAAWYEVDLERCLDSVETLDWIAQVAGKNSTRIGTSCHIGGLVRAVDDVLRLQHSLCGFGMNGGGGARIDERQVAELVTQFVSRHATHGCFPVWRYDLP